MTPAKIVVADIDPAKLSLARERGAAAVVDLRAPDAVAQLRATVGEGVRAVVDFVGSPETVDFSLKSAGRGADIVIVGLFGGSLPLSTALLPMRNTTLRGSYVGTVDEMRELLDLLHRTPALQVPLSRRPMSEINAALDELAAGRVAGRIVAIAE